jgi:hypothetical protein
VNLINTPPSPNSRGIFILDSGTLNRNECIDLRQNNDQTIILTTRSAGANTSQITSSARNGFLKIVGIYGGGFLTFYINGVQIGTPQTITTLPTSLSAIRIGYEFVAQGILAPNDRILLAGISKTALTQAEAIALTT